MLFAIIVIYSARVRYNYAKEIRRKSKIPDGKITYSDMNRPAKPFFSKQYRITGKPDYIIKKNDQYIPIEIKTGSYKQPHKNHILQLATYCQLIEENYRSFVPYGIIIYQDSDFKIPFNPSLRFELESVVRKMRLSLKNETVAMNHSDPGKCRFCSMSKYCTNKLI